MRASTLIAALSLLVLPATSAFAESDGNAFQPAAVASPAAGRAASAPAPAGAFLANEGEGSQMAVTPAQASRRATGRIAAGTFATNPGLNG